MPRYRRSGKHPPKADYRHPALRRRSHEPVPMRRRRRSTFSIASAPARSGVSTGRTGADNRLDGNDSFGDCTIAALAHAITVNRGLVDTQRIMAQQAVVKLYIHPDWAKAWGVALNELDVFDLLAGDRRSTTTSILACVEIDPGERRPSPRSRRRIKLFGQGLGFGRSRCRRIDHPGVHTRTDALADPGAPS